MTDAEINMDKIFREGIKRVDPHSLIRNNLSLDGHGNVIAGHKENKRIYPRTEYRRIVILGAGKASASMAAECEQILGDRITGGAVAVKPGHEEQLSRIEVLKGSHPVPDAASRGAALRIAETANAADGETLVILLISGGGSSLIALPPEGDFPVTLSEITETTNLLLKSGAAIQEVNSVRKHISGIKGGMLAKALHPAAVETFLLSDVVGDDPSVIASGPAFPDSSTFRDALDVLKKYGISDSVPRAVLRRIRAGDDGAIPETPGPDDIVFKKVTTRLLGTNRLALEGCRTKAEELGYKPLLLSSHITGEAREIAKYLAGIARDLCRFSEPLTSPACILSGGETTVTVSGSGKGGRNQECALSFLREVMLNPDDFRGITFLSGGTDGNDGPTDAAGAFASPEILCGGMKRGLDLEKYLAENDSYRYFDTVDALYRTGPTNTNVCDIHILTIEE
jgi:glycerate 2-kinase